MWTTSPRRPRSPANWRFIKVTGDASESVPDLRPGQVYRARIVDLTSESLIIEMTGVESKIEGLIEVLREDEGRILEICRSGKMTMRRGYHTSGVTAGLGHRRGRTGRRNFWKTTRPSSRSSLAARPCQRTFCESTPNRASKKGNREKSWRKTYYDHDADLSLIQAKKVAIIATAPGACPCSLTLRILVFK